MVDFFNNRFFPLFPKGWAVIGLVVFTLIVFLAYSLPLAGTDVYSAMMPYIFSVTFLYMLTFSPRDSWTNFKKAYFFDVPETTDKIMAVGMSIAGGIAGYLTYWLLSSRGMVILSFPSGLTLLNMGSLFIIVTFFIVAFYEEIFSLWFAGTIANNLYERIKNKDNLWIISLTLGTVIWTFTHIIAVGFNITSFMFIFSLGIMFRIIGFVVGKMQGRLYNPYFPLFFHWTYDVSFGLLFIMVM